MSPSWISSALRDVADQVDADEAPSRAVVSSRLRAAASAAAGGEVLVLAALPGEGEAFWGDDGTLQDRFDALLRSAGAVGVNWDEDVARVTVAAGRMDDVLRALGHVRSGVCGEDVADFAQALEPLRSDGLLGIAARVAGPRRKKVVKPVARRRREKVRTREERHDPVQQVALSDMLEAPTEFSCQFEISLSADFEGTTTKQKLLSRLKTEIVAAIKAGVSATAQELDLRPGSVLVRQLKADCAVNDASSFGDE